MEIEAGLFQTWQSEKLLVMSCAWMIAFDRGMHTVSLRLRLLSLRLEKLF